MALLTHAAAYFDYPLEQGLRRIQLLSSMSPTSYFDYPLEQGLRPEIKISLTYFLRVF